MTLRSRRWTLVLGLTAILGLTTQGAAMASTSSGAMPVSRHGAAAGLARADQQLATSLAHGGIRSDTCAAVRASRAALAAQGYSRAICFQQGKAQRTTATGHVSSKLTERIPQTSLFCPINRFEICTNTNSAVSIIQLNTGIVIGVETFSLQQDIQLNPNSLTFAENYNMDFTGSQGNVAGLTMGLVVTCGPFCTATTNFVNPSLAPVGGSFGGAISYSDSPLSVDATHSTYTLTATGPFLPGVQMTTSQTYRCDTISGISPGCVNPGYWPILFTMVSLPTISGSIRNVQSAGPHHYGRMNGGFPLHRNDSLQAANNAAACPPPGAQPPNTSCDEYPFASTSEGASQSQKPDWNSIWAPVSEQNSQGGLISSFYQSNRVLSGDAFWVSV